MDVKGVNLSAREEATRNLVFCTKYLKILVRMLKFPVMSLHLVLLSSSLGITNTAHGKISPDSPCLFECQRHKAQKLLMVWRT